MIYNRFWLILLNDLRNMSCLRFLLFLLWCKWLLNILPWYFNRNWLLFLYFLMPLPISIWISLSWDFLSLNSLGSRAVFWLILSLWDNLRLDFMQQCDSAHSLLLNLLFLCRLNICNFLCNEFLLNLSIYLCLFSFLFFRCFYIILYFLN